MSEYNQEQLEAIQMARRYLKGISESQMERLRRRIKNYLQFRAEVASFQERYFSEICSAKCFTSRRSACCGRQGIATFFADVVINGILSSDKEIDRVLETLYQDRDGPKCVYLSENGCVWRLKPIVCEMFLCQYAKESVLEKDKALKTQWEKLRRRERRYTWPKRPVLFDELEKRFIQSGFHSPLIYFHKSPGLLRIKARYSKNLLKTGV